ncbi:PREDICTED: TMV resistance [Prunus dulcis]|uniref:PREDICTED: TMV resistance n=1 Tax=Prunus dulcis TaxID=3755 RepID=A0A5E4F9H0_PRUDU|nr:PREDICTED: TMV resistance [Prunus dulcis]
MGRQIVRDENLLDPGMRTRLWDRDEIMNVFKDDKGTRHIQGIVLDFESRTMKVRDPGGDRISWNNFRRGPTFTSAVTYVKERYKAHHQNKAEKKREVIICSKPLAAMVNLRLLQINYVHLEGDLKFLPAELKCLQWKDSKLERLWPGRGHKVAEKLMLLNLTGCFNLTAIPDLSGNGALEKLILEHCTGLTKLHNSIGNLQTLVHLNLRECSNLIQLPNDVSGLTKLENLILSGCLQLKQLPNNMDRMVSLKELLLDDTAIISLPESIFRLTKLEKLSLNRCKYLKGLPDLIGKLCSLKEISLNGCEKLEKIPYSMGSLANLEKLSLLWCTSLSIIPDSIGNLKSLMEFYIYGSPIKELPVSIGSLSNLKELSTGNCQFLSRLPDSIGDLPHEIGALKTLEKLEMRKCASLRSLLESIGSMRALTAIVITEADITELPIITEADRTARINRDVGKPYHVTVEQM